MDARMVAVGFRSGEADTALSDIAERLQDKSDEKLQNLAGLLEPSLVALLSILVGLILLSVIASLGKRYVSDRITKTTSKRSVL